MEHKFKTTNIRGKQYVEVNERIKFFRQETQYKNWTISTEVTMTDDREECICKCIIADTEQRVIATGHAHEVKASSNINKTSFIENCETSAVGRALAMLGIGIDTSIASANEVSDAIAKQESKSKPSSKRGKPMSSADLPIRHHAEWAEMGIDPEDMPQVKQMREDLKKAEVYLQNATDKKEAWAKIEKQCKTKFPEEEYNALLEYVNG